MQFVKTADLKPGMRLAKPIYNKMGVLLYERDTKLTLQGINSIENFGLIGIFILEPAEPVPPLSEEDIEFERLQTIYVFKLKQNMDKLQANSEFSTLYSLAGDIFSRYGILNHKLNFTQNLRSAADFVYKHSINAAILCALIANQLHLPNEDALALITAALLYDFGYLYVPESVLDKGDNLTEVDMNFIQMNLERGYETIRPLYDSCNLPKISLDIIQQMIFRNSRSVKIKEPAEHVRVLYDILKVADEFDRLTAMNLGTLPLSEVAAMNILRKNNHAYNPSVVNSLAQCIHILPAGACIDLSDGEKALVLEENASNFMHPVVLKFSDNTVYDLSDPKIGTSLRIVDVMKTMDNRIHVDEETLKHFVADKYLKETTKRFRLHKTDTTSATAGNSPKTESTKKKTPRRRIDLV